jgi:hypothetical protein
LRMFWNISTINDMTRDKWIGYKQIIIRVSCLIDAKYRVSTKNGHLDYPTHLNIFLHHAI